MSKNSYSYLIPLINLLIAMLLGLLLRYIPIHNSISVNYKFFLHAHSHVAFLGWIFMALFALILKVFFNKSPFQSKTYCIQYWVSQISIIGMLIFFPIQGYALFSIIFSTLHIVVSWWFSYSLLEDFKTNKLVKEKFPISIKFIKASLFFLVLSSIGPFALGAFMAKGLSSHPIYDLSIYFYLHFQYNGWFAFAVIGIIIAIYESKLLVKNAKSLKYFFWLMFLACIPGYLLSTLYLNPAKWVFLVALISALVQVAAIFFVKKALHTIEPLCKSSLWVGFIMRLAFVCFVGKVILQLGSVFVPNLLIRNFVIGYLHLSLIGFISFALFGLFVYYNWLKESKFFKLSMGLITIGFIGSEVVIFGQGLLPFFGTYMPYYFELLFATSACMPIGIVLILVEKLKTKINQETLAKA
jgi:hypothetical protein